MTNALWTLSRAGLGRAKAPRLREINLRIEPGITAILGCSGAGKTSLLNLLVGFERPDRGEVRFHPNANGHALPVYWAPQDGGLWPHLTVLQHLNAVSGSEQRERIEGLLAAFDMRGRADACPDELSQGERTRLAVMRGLMADAAVLVMDEPMASVDTARSGRFWRAIRNQVKCSGASLVYTTHSPEQVIGEADRVICLRDGAVLYQGPVDELYERPPTQEAAECLGPINWFTPEESRLWLGTETVEERGVRPEHLEIVLQDNRCMVVEESRARGATSETALRHESGAQRTFLHRATREKLAAGTSVLLRLAVCLLAVALSACQPSNDPELRFSTVRTRSMPPDGASIPVPRALAVGNEDILAVVDRAGRIQAFDREGQFIREMRMPESAAGTPEGMCYLSDGMLAVADTHYHRVVFFAEDGSPTRMFGKEGTGPGEFIYPVGLALDDEDNLYVCEYGSNDRVQKFAPDGRFLMAFGTFGTGPQDLQRPSGLVWRDGQVYVADAINNRIQVFTDEGRFVGTLGGEAPPVLRFPYDIRNGPDNTLYVIEYAAGRLTQLDLQGRVVGRFGRTGPGENEFQTPWGLEVDSRGRVYVADTRNARIVELTP